MQIRVFDYLHFSSVSGLQGDSNLWFHKQLYDYLFKFYPDTYHFYLTYPISTENKEFMEKLFNYPNVTLLPIKYETTSGLSRGWFDLEGIKANRKLFDIIDVLFCNTIETTVNLLSYIQSLGFYSSVFSYTHWTPGMVSEPADAYYKKKSYGGYPTELKYILNYMSAHLNGCNSTYGRNIILNDLKDCITSPKIQNYLEKTLKPIYLTTDKNEFMNREHPEKPFREPIIIFNSRKSEYTGYPFFMKAIKRFIKLHPKLKFKIVMTSPSGKQQTLSYPLPNEYIAHDGELNREDYIKYLLWSDICIGAHDGQNQWSLSFLDGMMTNNIPLYRKNVFFDEMFSSTIYSFYNEDSFISKLHDILTNLDDYKQENKKIHEHFLKNWSWENLIHEWHNSFKYCYDQIESMTTSKKLDQNLFNDPITFKKIMKILNIGNQRGLTHYKKLLMKKYNLKDDITSNRIILSRDKNENRQ